MTTWMEREGGRRQAEERGLRGGWLCHADLSSSLQTCENKRRGFSPEPAAPGNAALRTAQLLSESVGLRLVWPRLSQRWARVCRRVMPAGVSCGTPSSRSMDVHDGVRDS